MKCLTSGKAFQEEFFRRNPSLRPPMELFECVPNAFFYAKDSESRFVRLNRANQAVYGVCDEEVLLGCTDRDFHPAALAEAYIAEDQRVMESRRPSLNQVWLVPYLQGHLQWFVSNKTPLIDCEGSVVGIAGVMYPIETPVEMQSYFGQLSPAIEYLETHFHLTISIAALARMSSLSTTHFNRLFRDVLRMSPTRYLLSLRIQKARQLLAITSKTIAEVATATGFYDQSHFTKRFQQLTGLTPREYRHRYSHATSAHRTEVP
jgi:AraC-like DNA-binding protein